MRRIFGLSGIVVATLWLALPPVEQAYSQQSGGVFVGRGKVERRARRDDRERDRPSYTDEDLKPMVSDRRLREIESLEQQCLDEINYQRRAGGVAPLGFSEELLEVARYYSRRMAEEGFFAHEDPEGRTVRQRVNEAGIRWRTLGENLAYSKGYTNPVAASLSGWMHSPGHRKNILDRTFNQTAVGAWISPDGTVYFTEIFLR
jgi:uncharacterized protein YkwD